MSREIHKSSKYELRACDKCKYDIDVVSEVNCGIGNHLWHYFRIHGEVFDMCCNCGIDADYILK